MESAFVTSFPDACSAFRAVSKSRVWIRSPLNFPDGETEASGGKETWPQSRGYRGAKPGLLMLPAQVSCLIGHASCNVEFSIGTQSILWQELSEASILCQKFKPSQLYWKEGILWGIGVSAMPPAPHPQVLCVLLFCPSDANRACLLTVSQKPVTKQASGKMLDTEGSGEKLLLSP